MSSSDEDCPNIQEIKRCLIEAQIYSDGMSKRDMFNYFKAVNQSKFTASQEMEQRRIMEDTEKNCKDAEEMLNIHLDEVVIVNQSKPKDSSEKPFIPKTWSSKTLEKREVQTTAARSPNTTEVNDDDSRTSSDIEFTSPKEDIFNPFDCPPTKHPPLKRIFRKIKYEIPFLFSEELSKLSLKERAKQIYEYHNTLIKKYRMQQSRSRQFAKWGKPISPSARFNGSLDKFAQKIESPCSDENENAAESIVSDFDSNADDFDRFLQSEKMKDSIESNKRLMAELSTQDSLFIKFPRNVLKEGEKQDETQDVLLSKPPQPSSTKKRQSRNLTNDEIITRSKLFQDVDVEVALSEYKIPKTSKAETVSKDDSDQKPVVKDDEKKEEENPRKRQNSENISELLESSGWINVSEKKSKTATSVSIEEEESIVDDSKKMHDKVTSELKRKYQKQLCPICNNRFFQSEIEAHASSCEAYT